MTPNEALRLAIDRGIWWRSRQSSMRPPIGRPGEIVASMDSETREALRALTAADASDVRTETVLLYTAPEPVTLVVPEKPGRVLVFAEKR